jgi:D-amino peptidase
MKVLVSVDMEGVTGVTCADDVRPGTPGWSHFRNLMTDEVNAAIEGFVQAGATEVLVNDSHSSMRNVVIDRLDSRATLLTGSHKKYSMVEGIDSGVDAVAFIGYHTGAGKQGILSHTYLGNTYTGVWINGQESSEGYMNTLLAAEFGVPVVLITGDDHPVADGKTYATNAGGVAVKECVDRYTAVCLPPKKTMLMITAGARKSLENLASVPKPKGPFTYRIQFDSTHPINAACHIPGVEQSGEREVSFTLPKMAEALRCFGAISTIVKSGLEQVYG